MDIHNKNNKYNTSDVQPNDLYSQFNKLVTTFVSSSIPLGKDSRGTIYFIVNNVRVYGIDTDNNIFEPSSTTINDYVDEYVQNSLTYKVAYIKSLLPDVDYDSLVNLKIKLSAKNRHLGKLYYYDELHKCIWCFNIFTEKWTKHHLTEFNNFFTNQYIIEQNEKKENNEKNKDKSNTDEYTTFDQLGISINSLKKLDIQFRDSYEHFYYEKGQKIYSKLLGKDLWYIKDNSFQTQLLNRINELI